LQTISLNKMNVNNTIEKGQQLWSSINKCVVDTVEASNIIVDSFIDQSTSLCFTGLYLLPTAFFHSTVIHVKFLIAALLVISHCYIRLLLDVQYKTAPLLFWPCSLLVLMEIILVASSLTFSVESYLSWGGGNKYWHGD
jgi:hypothetical protein